MTPKTDLENLATRLEQAGPESQAELLREAYEAIFGFSPKHDEWYGIEPEQRAQGRYFTAMLACGAYLSAAEMLVPEGWDYTTGRQDGKGWAALFPIGERGDPDSEVASDASTPALALAAAYAAADAAYAARAADAADAGRVRQADMLVKLLEDAEMPGART